MRNRKFTALLLSMLMTVPAIPSVLTATAATGAPEPDGTVTGSTLIGDADLDGRVGIKDVTVIQRYLAWDMLPTDEAMLRVIDADGSGTVNISDATEIQRFLAELGASEYVNQPYSKFYPWTDPTEHPTEAPTEAPTIEPTEQPTEAPTEAPTIEPTDQPTEAPTEAPTIEPTEQPTEAPTEAPTMEPTEQPTEAPSEAPTIEPTEQPTEAPTEAPTIEPTEQPTEAPTEAPTIEPTEEPTEAPTEAPYSPELTSLTLNAQTLKLGDTDYYQLIANGDPGLAAYLTFTSDAPLVAEVNDSGLITARSAGKASITCSFGELSAVCAVTVCPSATSLILNAESLTLGVGEIFDLNSFVNSGAAAYHRFYSSSDTSVATVTRSGGLVTATSPGTAEVYCTLLNGVKAVCKVTVMPIPESLTLNKTGVTLCTGEAFDFNSSIPKGTAAYYRSYYSENPEIVSITTSGGIATGVKPGKTRIYCQLANGVRAYATVEVNEATMRGVMTAHLRAQVGNKNTSYVNYINAHSDLNVTMSFPWCAVFAWSALDQFATKIGKTDPIAPGKHVSDLAEQARALGALHNRLDNDYMPKPGDLFTTSALDRPFDGGRDHIGYVEYVEVDSKGAVTKVHTIEGNYAWEVNGALDTYVWRGEWVPGVANEYGSKLSEYIDLEKLFSKK